MPQSKTAVPALDSYDDRSYAGAFRKRRTIAIGAAVIVVLSATVNNLPASAASMKEAAFAAASQTMASGATIPPIAVRDDLYTVTQYTPVRWPIAPTTEVNSGFGYRTAPCSWGCSSDHQGVDFGPDYGAPIAAIADGTVIASSSEGALGQHVIIEHQINGQMVQSVYGHMIYGSQTVAVGDTVTMGQVIGGVGSTGMSTGTHLHLEIRPDGGDAVEPIGWLATNVTETWVR